MPDERIDTKTDRRNLRPRREPYWHKLESGFFLGYRKLEQGEGTWIARIREDGKQKYQALGHFTEFDAAKHAAEDWRNSFAQGVATVDTTVADACREYVEHQKTLKGAASASDAEGRFRRLVYEKPIGRIKLSKLTTAVVRTWLNSQVADGPDAAIESIRRTKDSANRNLTALKAALNLALKDRLVATDAGWKTVTAFEKVGGSRKNMLSAADRTALLKACPADLRALVTGLLLTAARPGELAKALVGDFDKKHGTLVLDGKTGRRVVTLSTTARSYFAEQCQGKLPSAPIFATSYGKAWTKDDWKKPFKVAVIEAKLPADTVAYHLRHTAISEMILGGVQTSLVAMLAGTSTAMIDKHYGHLQHEQTRALLDSVAIV